MDEMPEGRDIDKSPEDVDKIQESVTPKDFITGASHAADSNDLQDGIVIRRNNQQRLLGREDSSAGRQIAESGEQWQNLIAAAITVASASHIELSGVTESAKERVNLIKIRVNGKWEPVNERDLEPLIRVVALVASQVAEAKQIRRAANKVLTETSIQETLQQLESRISELEAVANRVTDKIASADASDHSTLRWLVLGGAILLAAGAGAIIPLVAGTVTAEVILTNEIAIAAVVFAAATLLKDFDR